MPATAALGRECLASLPVRRPTVAITSTEKLFFFLTLSDYLSLAATRYQDWNLTHKLTHEIRSLLHLIKHKTGWASRPPDPHRRCQAKPSGRPSFSCMNGRWGEGWNGGTARNARNVCIVQPAMTSFLV